PTPVAPPPVKAAPPLPVAPPVAPALARPVAVAAPVAPPPKTPAPAPVAPAPVAQAQAPAVDAGPDICPGCGAKWTDGSSFCFDCGYMGKPTKKSANGAAPVPVAAAAPAPAPGLRIKGQYELTELINERMGVARFRGLDHGTGTPTPVMILRGEV